MKQTWLMALLALTCSGPALAAPGKAPAATSSFADEWAIQKVVTRFMKGRDTGNLEIYREVLAPDVEFGIPGSPIYQKGIDQVIAAGTMNARRFNPNNAPGQYTYGVMRHVITNIDIAVAGDTAKADYFVLTYGNNAEAKRPELVSVARNEDELVRVAGRWLLRRQAIHYDWSNEEMGRVMQLGKHSPPGQK